MEQDSQDSAVWDDSYSVGFDAIDYQHKDLVSMTNDLFQACKAGIKMDHIGFLVAMRKAATYAALHFSEEEKLMEKAGYPNLEKHKQEHAQFVATIADTVKKYEAREAQPIDMARFLKSWLLTHIAKSDKQYSPYLAKLK